MTLDEIRELDRDYLVPSEIASILGADAQDVRLQAKIAPEKLGFSVCVIGSRIKIPKVPFLRFMGIEI